MNLTCKSLLRQSHFYKATYIWRLLNSSDIYYISTATLFVIPRIHQRCRVYCLCLQYTLIPNSIRSRKTCVISKRINCDIQAVFSNLTYESCDYLLATLLLHFWIPIILDQTGWNWVHIVITSELKRNSEYEHNARHIAHHD